MDDNFEDPTAVLVLNDAGADNELDFREAVLGIIFCFCILATGIYMSHMYSSNEREEIAEVELHRVQAETDKIKEMETQRIEMEKVIGNYAISMTTITSSSTTTTTRTRALSLSAASAASASSDITIPNGNEDNCNEDEETETTNSSVISDDTDVIEDIEENTNVKIYFHKEDDDQEKEDEQVSSIPASTLLKAVENNPCAICLDVFQNDDNIIFCSNNILTGRGGYPHCFHQKCSLDYIVSHTEGLQAPCPCCRKAILCSYISSTDEEEGQQQHQEEEVEEETVEIPSFLSSHHSSVSLSHLVEAAGGSEQYPIQVE